MTLSRRLLVVALLCLLPSVAAGLFTQFDLQSRRTAELGELAMRQAEHAEVDIIALIEGARQLASVARRFPEVARMQPNCGTQLSPLIADMPRYDFLAVYNRDGTLMCASTNLVNADRPAWLDDITTGSGQDVGVMSSQSGVGGTFLPVGVPILDAAGARQGTVVAALDVAWMDRRQTELRQRRAALPVNTGLIVADRAGNIIVQHATSNALIEAGGWRGKLSPVERQLADLPNAGLRVIPGDNRNDMLAAYIPYSAQSEPIYVRVGMSMRAATVEIDFIALRGAMLVGSASLISLVLALAAGEAFIRLPTERLVAAAQRWRVGDLGVRAPTREERSEFGRLAVAFNEMAASLQQREAERERAAQLLEARVAERTAALSESNARLHVEIAEREKTEAALAQAQKLQAVGRLAGGVAHDFNNLLATVMGNLELLERRIEPTQERLHALIGRAMGAVQRGSQLTSRLLAFSRRHRTVTRVIEVNKIVGDLVILASSALGRRIEITTRLSDDAWPTIADPNQLESALLNLALNARDAMPDGGRLTIITRNETIKEPVDGLAAGEYVRIDVADNGAGMTPEVMARAFEPFFTTKGPGGSGLGLSQVYGIAQQAGGTVRLHSRQGEGTVVSILLPRTTQDLDTVVAARARRRLQLPLKVLLVDDDQPVRQATSEMLREMGCTVLEAEGGEEATAVLNGPDSQGLGMLIVDYAMPGLTGLQVAAMAHNMGFKIPVLLITGYAEVGEQNEPGADLLGGTLHKPFTAAELEAMLAGMQSAKTSAAVV